MSNRTAAIACAAIAGCVSIFSITSPLMAAPATPESAAKSADECLSGPKGATPAGAHWYYRIERGTKRKCWYLADEVAKTKKAATSAPASSDAAEETAPPPTKITPAPKQEAAKKPIQKSVANARAELTTGAPDDDSSLAETTWPPMPSPAAADVRADNQVAAMQPAPETAPKQGWNVATRWPEPNAAASASDQPSAATPAPAQPATPALTAERLATAAAPAPAAPPAPVTTAAAPAQPQQALQPTDGEGLSLRVLLSILVCVLALAAIVGPLLFKYFRPKPREDERTYGQRRQIWDLNESGPAVLQDNPPPALAPRYARDLHAHALPEPRMLDVTTDEIEELLARVSKRSAA
ncbi:MULTISPECIES: hypothetical protein [unclassified Afipia]|uniref:hypothetical protein n=1 Tax=unclassified Afipia TaxID=2642050 RepID=UPI000426CC43|nr:MULTISPECIES: hypothetical protein [unclassified Afipia]